MSDGAALLKGPPDNEVFTITTAPSFAAKWLVPRLDNFQGLNPGIKIRIDATMELADMRRDGINVAIRYGSGDYPGHSSERLFEEEMFPVCSPKLLSGPHPLKKPEDLVHHTLLHAGYALDNPSYPYWRMWLTSAGVINVDWNKGPEFSLENMAVQTAVEGHGVALVNTSIVSDDLASGALVRPFELKLPTDFGYFLVIPSETIEQPAVSAFREGLLGEACS